MQNCSDLTKLSRESSKRKVIYTLDKASELINKQLEESCDESESEIEVSDDFCSYFSDESDNETIDLSLLMNFYPNELVTESFQKKT